MNARTPHPRAGEGSSTPGTHSPQANARVSRLFLDLLELRLDDVLLVLRLAVASSFATRRGARRSTARPGLGRLGVHRLGELVRGAGERVRSAADLPDVLGLERLLRVGQCALDVALGGRVERATVLGERPFRLVDEPVELVAGVDEL